MTNYPYQQYNYGRTNYNMPNYMQPQYQMQPQMPQQPIMQPQQPQMETPLQNAIYATLKETEAYIMYPNSKILFIDKDKGMSYLKISNNDGQSYIRYFKNVEVQADGTPLKPQNDTKLEDYAEFVKKDDLKAFVGLKEYEELYDKVNQIQKQLMGVKNNGTKTQ